MARYTVRDYDTGAVVAVGDGVGGNIKLLAEDTPYDDVYTIRCGTAGTLVLEQAGLPAVTLTMAVGETVPVAGLFEIDATSTGVFHGFSHPA